MRNRRAGSPTEAGRIGQTGKPETGHHTRRPIAGKAPGMPGQPETAGLTEHGLTEHGRADRTGQGTDNRPAGRPDGLKEPGHPARTEGLAPDRPAERPEQASACDRHALVGQIPGWPAQSLRPAKGDAAR
jgi:hypothetical protein